MLRAADARQRHVRNGCCVTRADLAGFANMERTMRMCCMLPMAGTECGVEEVHGAVRDAKVRRRNARLGNDGIVDASAPRGVAKRH